MESKRIVERNRQLVEQWNAKHSVGTFVTALKDDGGTVQAKSRTRAVLLGSGMAAIWLAGVLRAVSLPRVRPVHEEATA